MRAKALLLSLSLFFIMAQLLAQAPAAKPMTHNDSLAAVDTVIIHHNVYNRHANWFAFGAGNSLNKYKQVDGSLALDYQFKWRKVYIQSGIMRGKAFSGSYFPGDYDRVFNELHLAIGQKNETRKAFTALFIGAGLIQGEFAYPDDPKGQGENFTTVGLTASAQLIFKPVYDVGLGLNAFANANTRYALYGVRLVVFLSNAYKGQKWR
jgi:hypothetical protein